MRSLLPPAPSVPLPARRAHADEVLRELRAEAPVDRTLGMRRPVAPQPVVLTDWSARLADGWKAVDVRLDKLHVRIAAEQVGMERSHAVAVCMLTRPLFADLADFAAELDDDRGAMLADVNAERVLLNELAPFADAVKAGA